MAEDGLGEEYETVETPSPPPPAAQAAEPAAFSGKVDYASRLFSLGADCGSLQVGGCLCAGCEGKLTVELGRRERESRSERDLYQKQLLELDRLAPVDAASTARGGEGPSDPAALAALEAAVGELRARLQAVQREHDEVEGAQTVLEREVLELDALEGQFWREHNAFSRERSSRLERKESLETKLDRLESQEEYLRNTNVYNDSFYIWHDGNFGTINKFRLGRLPNQVVEWSEINAAWGQVVLLLHTMANEKSFRFEGRCFLRPMGSFSKVEFEGQTFDLFGSGSWFGSFDKGMERFLQCVRQFGEYAEREDPSLKLPYRIDDSGRIGVQGKPAKWFPIKKRFNDELKWTNALKYMLTNLKWLVAWFCRRQPMVAAGGAAGGR